MPAVAQKVGPQAENAKLEAAVARQPAAAINKSPQQIPLWASDPLPIRFSLKVNTPGDPYEQEADRVVAQVMRMPAAEPLVQRKMCACGRPMGPDGMCDECQGKQMNIQRKSTGDAGQSAAPSIVHQALQQPGRPLDSATRHFMEARLGQDFGRVRVHTDDAAAASAEAVNARAYTAGQNVVFNQGEYRPGTADGNRLLAHELVHTLQQGQGPAPILARKKGDNEDATKQTKLVIEAQKALWDDIHAFFPNDGRKLAGSGYNPAVSQLEVSFVEGLVAGVFHSPPVVIVGKDYLTQKDADKRKAWLKAALAKINEWRVKTGRIDDQDVGDAEVTRHIDKLDLSGKLDVLRKMEARKELVANGKMQEFVRNRIHSTPLMAGAVTKDDGSFEVQFENVKIIVKPDVLDSSEVSSGAHTSIQPVGSPNFNTPGYNWDGAGKIKSITFTPTVPQVVYEIQTHYAPGVEPGGTSGYGFGSRSTDVGEKKTLRFHEGSHGTVFIREVKANISANKYPAWKGKLKQTRQVFEGHLSSYKAGVKKFRDMLAKALETSVQEVDCAGKTIEEYHQEHGTATKVKCNP